MHAQRGVDRVCDLQVAPLSTELRLLRELFHSCAELAASVRQESALYDDPCSIPAEDFETSVALLARHVHALAAPTARCARVGELEDPFRSPIGRAVDARGDRDFVGAWLRFDEVPPASVSRCASGVSVYWLRGDTLELPRQRDSGEASTTDALPGPAAGSHDRRAAALRSCGCTGLRQTELLAGIGASCTCWRLAAVDETYDAALGLLDEVAYAVLLDAVDGVLLLSFEARHRAPNS